jgi:hypothetical protein
MPVCAPELAQHLQDAFRKRDVTLFVSFPVPHVNHHPLAVDVPNLEANPFGHTQSAGIDGIQANPKPGLTNMPQYRVHFGNAEHHRQLFFSRGTYQVQRPPLSPKGMHEKELDTGTGDAK